METPDLSYLSTSDLVDLMGACGQSDDPTDKAFVKACRDEIASRKPSSSGTTSDETVDALKKTR